MVSYQPFLDALRRQIDIRNSRRSSPVSFRLNPPCDEEQIMLLQTNAARQLGRPLPEPFIDFLRITDGFTENGVTIYSSKSAPYLGRVGNNRQIMAADILEENERHRIDAPEWEGLMVFGNTDMQASAYQITEDRYIWMPLGGLKPDEVFDSFDTMMAATLRLALLPEFRPDPWKDKMPR
jgi:hypothetical protein